MGIKQWVTGAVLRDAAEIQVRAVSSDPATVMATLDEWPVHRTTRVTAAAVELLKMGIAEGDLSRALRSTETVLVRTHAHHDRALPEAWAAAARFVGTYIAAAGVSGDRIMLAANVASTAAELHRY